MGLDRPVVRRHGELLLALARVDAPDGVEHVVAVRPRQRRPERVEQVEQRPADDHVVVRAEEERYDDRPEAGACRKANHTNMTNSDI